MTIGPEPITITCSMSSRRGISGPPARGSGSERVGWWPRRSVTGPDVRSACPGRGGPARPGGRRGRVGGLGSVGAAAQCVLDVGERRGQRVRLAGARPVARRAARRSARPAPAAGRSARPPPRAATARAAGGRRRRRRRGPPSAGWAGSARRRLDRAGQRDPGRSPVADRVVHHQRHEPVEQVRGVVRPGRGLRVVLHAERREVLPGQALDAAVVRAGVGDPRGAVGRGEALARVALRRRSRGSAR